MKSIKHFLIVGLTAISTLANAQVNSTGTFYIGAGFGGSIGGSAVETGYSYSKENSGSLAAGVNLGLKAQYSFSDKFSAGLYFKRGVTGYANSSENYEWNTITSKSTIFGIEAKYYVLNKRKILLSLGPQFGLLSSKDGIELGDGNGSFSGYEEDGESNGFNYGINFGLNLFWSEHIGMFVDVGINGSSYKGELNRDKTYKYKNNAFGIAAGLGIIAKFGGTPPPPRTE